jgi:acetyl esterase/lipase
VLEIDPQIAKALASAPPQPLRAETLSTFRAGSSKSSAPSPGVERRDYVIDPERGVAIRVHRPAGAGGGLPCVYSMHGGGYVFGSFANDDARLDGWSGSYRCVGVSVDYRLAPETPYPGPLDDCYLGLKWVFDHHDELGVDPDRIGASGTSAGAGLAAGLALLTRDRGEMPLQFQLLDAPMIDDRQQTLSSQRDDLVIFDRKASEFGWRSRHVEPGRQSERRSTPMNQASSAQTDVAARVWSAMRAFVTANDRNKELQEGLGLGRGTGRVKVLLMLTSGPATLRDIADANQIDAPYATVIVDKLVSLGLVERTAHPDDLRRKLVKITEAGLGAVEQAKRIYFEPPPGLAALAPADLNLLDEVLTRLIEPPASTRVPRR